MTLQPDPVEHGVVKIDMRGRYVVVLLRCGAHNSKRLLLHAGRIV